MSDLNIYVSNGTCYTAAGKELDKSFIPCGNDAFGHQTCCGAGDNCLADNACFGVHGSGYGSSLTYLAGCTDPDYKDTTCPDKKGIDQPWIALTLCDNSDGTWAACSQEGNPSTLKAGSFCSCTNSDSATVAFSDSNTLANVCSLPQSIGASIQFIAGHFPTSPAAAGTTAQAPSAGSSGGSNGGSGGTATATQPGQTTATSGGTGTGAGGNGGTITRTVTNTAQPGSTGTDPSSGSSSSGSSSGTKIGIGVGVAIGALALLAAITALLLFRRKRRRAASAPEIEKATSDPEGVPATSATPSVSKADGQLVSEVAGKPISKADRPGVSEADGQALLETDGQPVSKADRPGVSEADGQAISEADGRAARPWSMRSELEGSKVVPNSTTGDASGGRVRRSGELPPVAELPGSNSWHGEGQAPVQGGQGPSQGSEPLQWGAAWRVRE